MKTIYKINDVEVSIGHFYKFIEGVHEMPFELIRHEIDESWLARFTEIGVGKADKVVVEIYGRSCVDVTYHNGDKQVLCSIDTIPPTFSVVDVKGAVNDISDVPTLKKALDELAEANPAATTLKHSDIDFRKITAAIKLASKFNVVTIEYQQGGNDVFHLEFEYSPSFAEAVAMGMQTKKHEVMLVGYEFFTREFSDSHPDSVLNEANK